MRDEYDEYEGVAEERGRLGTFLLGAVVGAAVALVLAPRTGRDTQAELARVLGGLRESAGGPVDGTRQTVAGWAGRARGGLAGRLDEVRAVVDDRMDRVRGAVDEGRLAATQARVELRRRVDEAKAAYRTHRAPARPGPPVLAVEPAAGTGADEVVVTGTAVERDAGDLA